jgi:hypothetical protein
MKTAIFVAVATLGVAVGASADALAQTCSCPSGGSLVATSTSGDAVKATATSGVGVLATSSTGLGVSGSTTSAASTAAGVAGNYTATTGSGVGVAGTCASGSGIGVYGLDTASTSGFGIYGAAMGVGATGVYGTATETTDSAGTGVEGYSTSGNGVVGHTDVNAASGVYGYNDSSGIGGIGTAGGITTPGLGIAIYGNNATTNANGWAGYFNGKVYITAGLSVNGTCVSGNCSSDERLKKNIKPLVGALDDLVKLRPVTFEWKETDGPDHSVGVQTGFIAQDVEKVKPEWVATDDQGFKTINMARLPVFLVDSVRTLKLENDDLRVRIKALEESGRRPMTSGVGMDEVGIFVLALACAFGIGRRWRQVR